MTKWEYDIAVYEDGRLQSTGSMPNGDTDLPVGADLFDYLDQAGKRGWEFCGAVPSPGEQQTDLTFIFKRPLE